MSNTNQSKEEGSFSGGYSIVKREQSWGVQYMLRFEGDWRDFATLTIDNGGTVFGSPRGPEINWSAVGSQTPALTAEFAKGLLELVALSSQSEAR